MTYDNAQEYIENSNIKEIEKQLNEICNDLTHNYSPVFIIEVANGLDEHFGNYLLQNVFKIIEKK